MSKQPGFDADEKLIGTGKMICGRDSTNRSSTRIRPAATTSRDPPEVSIQNGETDRVFGEILDSPS